MVDSAETARAPKRARISASGDTSASISDVQWQEFWEQGYVNLGKVISQELLLQMEKRIDDIMMGNVQYGHKLMMQLDPGGAYGDEVQSIQTASFKGASRAYRKIGEAGYGLECDDVFRDAMTLPLFRDICARVYGAHTDISIYRAMVFNKPAQAGTDLPWHQDGGEWWGLDRDPQIFVWTALDEANAQNGCVQVVPGSHKLGILSRRGHTLSEENLKQHDIESRAVNLEVARGESVLMHNFLVHRSGTNPSSTPRRAFSVNYADGRTRVVHPRPVVQPEGHPGPELGLKEPNATLPVVFRPAVPEF